MTIHPRRTTGLLGVLALATIGTLGACSESSESPEPAASAEEQAAPTTLTFTISEKDAEQDEIDAGKKGESIGDRHIGAMTLQADGEDVGRMHTDCLVVDDAYEGQMCSMVLMVPGGTIAIQNAGLHKPLGEAAGDGMAFAVTGGTGDYADARGEMTVGQEESDPMTITLLP